MVESSLQFRAPPQSPAAPLPVSPASSARRRRGPAQIGDQIGEVNDQILQLPHRIPRPFRGVQVRFWDGRLRRLRLRIKLGVLERITTESFAVAGFDELAHRELPALVRAGTQARQLLWIHAESARHLDLPSIEFADPLCISPNFLIIPSTLRRHAYTSHWPKLKFCRPQLP